MADLILDLLVEQSVLLNLGVTEQVFLNAEASYVTVPGPIGPAGPQGAQGIQGIQGNQGTPGAAGLDGNTILFGNIAPDNSLGIDDNFLEISLFVLFIISLETCVNVLSRLF